MRFVTYSNVVATVCLFVVLGGGAYAAAKLDGRDLKARSVTGNKLRPNTLGGRQIQESKLGTVRRAASADKLGTLSADDVQTKVLWARFDELHPSNGGTSGSDKPNVAVARNGLHIGAVYCQDPSVGTPDFGTTGYTVSNPEGCDYAVAIFDTTPGPGFDSPSPVDFRKCSFAAVADPRRTAMQVEHVVAGPAGEQSADSPAPGFYVAMKLSSKTYPERVPGLSVQAICP